MINNSINQVEKTDALPVFQPNIPPQILQQPYIHQQIPQQYINQQAGQQYIVKLAPQQYAIQQPDQPPLANQPTQSYLFQPSDQSKENKQIQPLLIQSVGQNNINNSVAQSDIVKFEDFKSDEFIIKDSNYYKKKLCFPRFWTLFMLYPCFVDVFFSFWFNRKPIVGIIGCFINLLVTFLVNQSAEKCDSKKYNIALILYIIYFVFSCAVNIYVFFSFNDLSTENINSMNTIYLFDFGFQTITIFLLYYYKKKLNKDHNPEKEKLDHIQEE